LIGPVTIRELETTVPANIGEYVLDQVPLETDQEYEAASAMWSAASSPMC